MVDAVRIPRAETEMAQRLRQAIGAEAHASFARRAGVAESVLRKYLAGAVPSADRLVRMADAAGVRVEWLAAGRGEIRDAEDPRSPIGGDAAAISALTAAEPSPLWSGGGSVDPSDLAFVLDYCACDIDGRRMLRRMAAALARERPSTTGGAAPPGAPATPAGDRAIDAGSIALPG